MIPNVDRRRRSLRALLFLTALLFAVAPPVRATVVIDPVKVRMESPTRVAEPGKPFDAVLEIRAFEDVTIDDLFLNTGRSWRLSAALPEVLHLAKGEVRRIPVTVTTDDPSEPLTLEYQVGSDVVRKAIDLSPA